MCLYGGHSPSLLVAHVTSSRSRRDCYLNRRGLEWVFASPFSVNQILAMAQTVLEAQRESPEKCLGKFSENSLRPYVLASSTLI